MKKVFVILLTFILLSQIKGQDVSFYDEKGEMIFLEIIDSLFQVKFEDGLKQEEMMNILSTIVADIRSTDRIIGQQVIIESRHLKLNAEKVKNLEGIKYINGSLIYSDGTIQIPTDKIMLNPKDGLDIKEILANRMVKYSSIKDMGFDKNAFLVELVNGESIKIANELYESGYFVAAQPSFTRLKLSSNPMYSGQWGLNNTGQNNGTSGIDINAPEAWMISSGNSNIKVAVIDQGVDLDHPDLYANILSGYDATDGGLGGFNGDCYGNDTHGTACAGIITAINNNIGIKGVAPNCKIVPIRVTYTNGNNDIWSDSWIVSAINYAWNTAEVDILSCSWGGGTSNYNVNNAISNALNNGRNGRGCVVIFSVGNSNGTVAYPANSNPDIISVGAISQCGQRKSPSSCDGEQWIRYITTYPYYDYLGGSNYDTTLDVVAPGVLIPTTDIQGSSGYNTSNGTNGNYFASFNGTSAATPHVAGIVALMLSVNPFLTQNQARDFIESTAQKIRTDLYTYSPSSGRTNGTWNDQMGYGLVNAYAAVNAVNIKISGPTTLCSSGGSYSISNVPAGATITWSSGPDIQRQSAQGANPCTFMSISDGDSYVQATITYNGQTITLPSYNVYSGLPPAPPDRYAANVDGYDGYYTKILNSGTAYFTMTNTSSFGKWWDTQWATSTTHGGNDYYLDIDADVLGTNYVLPYWTNACGISAPGPSVILEVVLGKSANQGEISFGLSPNPAEQYVDIKINLPDDMEAVGTYWVEFVNPYSVVAKKVELDGPGNRVSVADLPKGYYVVRLLLGKDIYTNKLVIE